MQLWIRSYILYTIYTERMTLEEGKRIEFTHDPPSGTKERGFFFTPAGAAYLSSYHGCCQWAWPYTTDRWVF